MLINTYNGRVLAGEWVRERLRGRGLSVTGLIPLQTDTALVIGTKNEQNLAGLNLDPKTRLISRVRALGFRRVCLIPAEVVHVPDWADLRCRFGCALYGKPACPPDSPSPRKTRDLLKNCTTALLLEGEPPAGAFQRRVLRAEKEAFAAGFYKAFAFWAGPCALCTPCAPGGVCGNPRQSGPSMEGAGIDVFASVRRAGLSLRTLPGPGDFVKYFALVLLE